MSVERNGKPLQRAAVRMLGYLAAILIVLIGVEMVVDVYLTGVSLDELRHSSEYGRAMVTTVSRGLNNLMTMVLAFIALAIPITANMYTPKLIEVFVNDRVNRFVLLFVALMCANALFVQGIAVDQWTPPVQYTVVWVSGVIGFAILIPYYFYVLSFLDPDTIIDRVTERVLDEFDEIRDGKRDVAVAQARLDARILHLGNVILRAVDRADRDVTLRSLDALRRVVNRYGHLKPKLAEPWFDVNPSLFVGISDHHVNVLREDRIWVEHRALNQLLLAFKAALAKMDDAISAIADINRKVALHAARIGDRGLLDLCVRFFNTFLRGALQKRDVHAVFHVYDQYRLLAEGLLEAHPETAVKVARYFKYYAGLARFRKLPFVAGYVAHQLGVLVERAYEAESEARQDLLDAFLAFDPGAAEMRIVCARAMLAGYFESTGREHEGARVAATLEGTDEELLAAARTAIATTESPTFWEVTDRQRNLDYVEPERRAHVVALLDRAIGGLGPRHA